MIGYIYSFRLVVNLRMGFCKGVFHPAFITDEVSFDFAIGDFEFGCYLGFDF